MTVQMTPPTAIRPVRAPAVPLTTPDERAARRSLLDQITRLEEELSGLFCSAWPRTDFDWNVRSQRGPRVLSFAELEEVRDDLSARVADARRALSERSREEERTRCLIEQMLLEPERHKWIRVANADIGEPGCKTWHVRPRWGLLGMLMNWWRVVVSSGCPLAGAPGTYGARAESSRL